MRGEKLKGAGVGGEIQQEAFNNGTLASSTLTIKAKKTSGGLRKTASLRREDEQDHRKAERKGKERGGDGDWFCSFRVDDKAYGGCR